MIHRASGRKPDQLRAIKIAYNSFGYAPGSVLFELGNTKVLCAASIAPGVPPFLKGSKTGWLTAEYAMLPTSGQTRAARETTQFKKNERAVEISRLIGRALRAVVDLSAIGERTIFIDCDVLQADGSTRTASITGSYLALAAAVDYWIKSGILAKTILTDAVGAVSVGFMQGLPLLDLDYAEDSTIDADYNFVFTQSGNIIEIQGAAEKSVLSWHDFEQIKECAIKGNQALFAIVGQKRETTTQPSSHAPLFSLKNRLAPAV